MVRRTILSNALSQHIPYPAEVYSPLAAVNDGGKDITERGGRYTSDFIWNTQWRKRLEYEDSINRAIERAKNAPPEEGPEAGTVSFSRRALLDSMDVDLSAQLRPRQKKQPAAAAPPRPVQKRTVYLKPSQGETRKWDRRGRFGRVCSLLLLLTAAQHMLSTHQVAEEKPVTVSLTEDQLASMEQERHAYSTLQRELLLYTLGATGVIFTLTWIFYTADTAISYAVGAVGGLVYLRLLNKTCVCVVIKLSSLFMCVVHHLQGGWLDQGCTVCRQLGWPTTPAHTHHLSVELQSVEHVGFRRDWGDAAASSHTGWIFHLQGCGGGQDVGVAVG